MLLKIYILLAVLLSTLCIGQNTSSAAVSARSKPQPPVQIDIAPVTSGGALSNIKPGDTIEFRVTVRASSKASEMRVLSTLVDGAKHVSGDLTWSGEVSKGQVVVLPMAVRSSQKGKGKIVTKVELFSDNTLLYSSQGIYELGKPLAAEPRQPRGTRKDSRGHGVAEYR